MNNRLHFRWVVIRKVLECKIKNLASQAFIKLNSKMWSKRLWKNIKFREMRSLMLGSLKIRLLGSKSAQSKPKSHYKNQNINKNQIKIRQQAANAENLLREVTLLTNNINKTNLLSEMSSRIKGMVRLLKAQIEQIAYILANDFQNIFIL